MKTKATVMVSLLAFILLGASAYGYSDRNTGRPTGCFDDGQAILSFGSGGKPYYASDLKVIAQKMFNNEPRGEPFEIEGWYYSEGKVATNWGLEYPEFFPVDYSVVESTVNNKGSVFASKEGYFKYPATYLVNITNQTGDAIESLKISCPGMIFSCELINVSLQRCFTKDGKFYVYFSADGIGKQSSHIGAKDVNLSSDMQYIAKAEKRSFYVTPFLNSNLTHLGGTDYLIDMETPHNFNTFEIRTLGCDPDHPMIYETSRDKITCAEPPECLENSECDDGDECTEDRCAEESCTHKEIPRCGEEIIEPLEEGPTETVEEAPLENLTEVLPPSETEGPPITGNIIGTGEKTEGDGNFFTYLINLILGLFGAG